MAVLKNTMARLSGEGTMSSATGMRAALIPRVILRALSRVRCLAGSRPADPAADKPSRTGERVGNPRVVADLLDVQSALVVEILWKPENEEKPGGIGKEFRRDQSPHLTVTQEIDPPDSRNGRRLGGVRRLVIFEPDESPNDPDRACDEENPAPVEIENNEGDERRRNNRA